MHKKHKSSKANDNITKRNHYVPQWYQKRFIKKGETRYWCLDKNKDTDNEYFDIPKSFFQQKHLYTVDLFGQKSDIIEKLLFGDIDVRGSKAIDIIAIKDGWNTERGHEGWQDFTEFMNAQKLRTPKGLDWIKKELSILPGFDYAIQKNNLVLSFMQSIRQMYCTMWTEAIWEIVSARNSEVKFIVSDNPVTFYNYRINPETDGNRYPDEPLLEMIGTQTIYPLSLNNCLILTHRQLALDSETASPLKSRINTRYYDQAIFSFESIIYCRELTEENVCIFNYVLKKQSKNHIAAAKKDWLFPEKRIGNPEWQELHKLFLPPKDKIHRTTSIFMGHIDGSVEGFDPYGQKITDPQEIESIKGSMLFIKKYRRDGRFSNELKELLNKYDKPNIEEQNSLFIEGIIDIFKIKDIKPENLREDFTPDKVQKLYWLIEDLWPAGTDVFKMLKHEEGFNLIYSGEMNIGTLARKLLILGLYFDKVYITNPFPNPCCIRDSHNPLKNPEQYLVTTYNLLLSIIPLIPWITTGQIQIMPNPFALDFSFRQAAMDSVDKRKGNIDLRQDPEFVTSQYIKQFESLLFITPDQSLENTIKNLIPNMPKNLITEMAKDIRFRKESTPLLWTKSLRDIGPQFLMDKLCENMETIIYLTHLTNAVPYTYIKIKKAEMESINAITSNSVEHDMKFLNCVDGEFVKTLKDCGFLEKVRLTLRKIKNEPSSKALHEELEEVVSKTEEDWQDVEKVIKTTNMKNCTTAIGKLVFNTGQFDLPLVQNHIKKIYGDESLSNIRMYISTNF